MSGEDLLTQSIDKLVDRYSMLFVLPSHRKILFLLTFFCISVGIISTFYFFPLTIGVSLGFFLLILTLISDYLVSNLVLKDDPIYTLRRTTALSLFCWILWFVFIFIGSVISKLCRSSIIPFWLLGFSAVLVLRLLVFKCTVLKGCKSSIVATVLPPILCIISILLVWPGVDYSRISLFLVYSLGVSLFSGFTFLYLLNNIGKQTLGFSSLPLFKAFLINWITDLNLPFETYLEKVGTPQDVEVAMMRFGASKPQAAIIVPTIHPGPFKNVGSSLLPSLLKNAIEKELGCVTCVPHGLLGHEIDLASQAQNHKVIRHIIDSLKFHPLQGKASPYMQTNNDLAKVGCQMFGETALISLSLAPKTTEDLPKELGIYIRNKAEEKGVSNCVIVNAHNSLNGDLNVKNTLSSLKDAASDCLEKSTSLRHLPFRIGAATIYPESFSLKDGMGPGGITSIVVEVGNQKTAYVIIDGNNMISGLREKILSHLKSHGLDNGEIFTTDTHSVNALTLNKRGYHPIGESMDQEVLINHIWKVTRDALSCLKPAAVGTRTITISDVKVIGEEVLCSFSLLAERTIQRAKKIILPIFGATGLLLMSFLIFF